MQIETPALGDEQLRAKYSEKDRKALAAKGQAMPDGSYPIADEEDLQNAIHAVGRGGASHDAIRKHIIARAAALGASSSIPDNWNSDGSLKQANSRRVRKPRHRAIPLLPEVRHLAASNLEVRDAGGSGDTVTVTGMPIVYNIGYSVVDAFGEFEERMLPGVASDVMGADVRFLIDHDPSRLLARTASGTLKLSDSDGGLRMVASIDLRDTDAQNLMVRLERGDVSEMSCGFIVGRDEWNDDMDQRTVQKLADLLDVSAVTYPASPTTSIEVAQRMALRMQVESRARLRRLYADIRAGKSISASNQALIVSAVKTLHGVLDASGLDPGDLIGREDHPVSTDADGDDVPAEPTAGMMGANDDDNDGLSGEPLNDPGEQIRSAPTEVLLAAITERHGRRRSQSFQESDELLKQAKLRIIRK